MCYINNSNKTKILLDILICQDQICLTVSLNASDASDPRSVLSIFDKLELLRQLFSFTKA